MSSDFLQKYKIVMYPIFLPIYIYIYIYILPLFYIWAPAPEELSSLHVPTHQYDQEINV